MGPLGCNDMQHILQKILKSEEFDNINEYKWQLNDVFFHFQYANDEDNVKDWPFRIQVGW